MNLSHHTNIIVGLSGGVDSAVSALLLKEQGYDVTGVYMQNWILDKNNPYCHAEQDLLDAKTVCKQLQIPFQVINFSKEYWNLVFQHCLDEFAAGHTPNPDIWCNQLIKFDAFLKYALQSGAKYLVTGHYARIVKHDNKYQLLKACDLNKDQSYFLYTLHQNALSHALFPLGNLTKTKVREIAKKANLSNFNKKDSTGICFIGERKFKDFLKDFMLTRPGNIKTVDGEIIGKHDGLMFYTLGQRKGLHIGGLKNKNESPWYVVNKDIPHNTLIVAQGCNHPLLFSDSLVCEKLHWISEEMPKNFSCTAKTRYRQADQRCEIVPIDDNRWKVTFPKPQRAVTSGQSIVFYDNNVCLGGGIICLDQ